MAKLYTIKLTPHEKEEDKGETTVRTAELGILGSAVAAYAQKATIDQFPLCIDLRAQLEAVTDAHNEIRDMSREDIDIFKKGFEMTASIPGAVRPTAWLRCGSLINQLRNPIEQGEAAEK